MRPGLFALLLLTGCSTMTESKVMQKAVDDDQRRQHLFEATLEMLDRNPQYVDDFFRLTLRHHATLERLTIDETKQLKDPKLAKLNAMYLRDHPESLQQVMEQTLAQSADRPEAQKALGNAIKSALKEPNERSTLKQTIKDALKGD